jgi:DNA repair protein RadC
MKHLIVLEEPIDNIKSAIELFEKIKKIDIDFSKENFIVFTLDTKHRVIDYYVISVGILDASLIHPREVFRNAIKDNAQSIIIAHNHPSGVLTPSDADKEVTECLKKAGELIGISVLDHIIFCEDSFISMIEQKCF